MNQIAIPTCQCLHQIPKQMRPSFWPIPVCYGWDCICLKIYSGNKYKSTSVEEDLQMYSTLRVRSLQIYICTPQCHFLSWTCSLSVTNSITGNSWCHPVKTVTHKKVLLELEFSPGHEDVPSMLSWSWEMPRITSHNRLPSEHENNLPHLTWLYWLIPVALLVKDDESLPWPKTQEKEKISVTFDN